MLRNLKKRYIFYTIYWLLLAYIITALGWWFYELYDNNFLMADLKLKKLNIDSSSYAKEYAEIIKERKSNAYQFLGEGLTFLIVILTGALYLYRIVVKALKRNEEQRNFMMAITHELKTPIAVSKLNLETIQRHKLSDEQQNKLLSNTLTETKRLDTLCNNLLVSYQLGENAFKLNKIDINLTELVDDIVKIFQAHFPARKIVKNLQEQIFVKGDAFLLEIAINNLLENAAKYSPKDKAITINITTKKGLSLLGIIDEGDGISDADKKLVFTKFYRTGNAATKSAKGTGLGLFLVSKICALHDGKITIGNNPNGGSIFTFVLNTIG